MRLLAFLIALAVPSVAPAQLINPPTVDMSNVATKSEVQTAQTAAAPGVKCKVTSTTNTGFIGAQCVQSVLSVSVLGSAVEVVAGAGTQIFALSLPSTQANR